MELPEEQSTLASHDERLKNWGFLKVCPPVRLREGAHNDKLLFRTASQDGIPFVGLVQQTHIQYFHSANNEVTRKVTSIAHGALHRRPNRQHRPSLTSLSYPSSSLTCLTVI